MEENEQKLLEKYLKFEGITDREWRRIVRELEGWGVKYKQVVRFIRMAEKLGTPHEIIQVQCKWLMKQALEHFFTDIEARKLNRNQMKKVLFEKDVLHEKAQFIDTEDLKTRYGIKTEDKQYEIHIVSKDNLEAEMSLIDLINLKHIESWVFIEPNRQEHEILYLET